MGERLGFWERPLSCNNDALFSIASMRKEAQDQKCRQQTSDQLLQHTMVRLVGKCQRQPKGQECDHSGFQPPCKCHTSYSKWNPFPQTLCLQAFPFICQLISTKNAEHEETSKSKSMKVWLNSKQFIILKIFDTEAYFVLILPQLRKINANCTCISIMKYFRHSKI